MIDFKLDIQVWRLLCSCCSLKLWHHIEIEETGNEGTRHFPNRLVIVLDICQKVAPKLIKGMKIHSKPENVGFNLEAKTYRWKEDASQGLVDEPLKINDHAMDAMRYAIYTHLFDRVEFRLS